MSHIFKFRWTVTWLQRKITPPEKLCQMKLGLQQKRKPAASFGSFKGQSHHVKAEVICLLPFIFSGLEVVLLIVKT